MAEGLASCRSILLECGHGLCGLHLCSASFPGGAYDLLGDQPIYS